MILLTQVDTCPWKPWSQLVTVDANIAEEVRVAAFDRAHDHTWVDGQDYHERRVLSQQH